MPSRRSSSQSPPGAGSTVPRISSPSKVPPVTAAMRRRPYGVSPTSVMSGSTVSDRVKRWFERSSGLLIGSSKGASNARAAAGPVGLAQLALHDLADGAARKRVAKLDADQPLRLAELAVGPRHDLGLAHRGAVAAYAQRERRLAPLLAWDADHGGVDDVGMLQQQHLDVGGIDVEAAGYDHVLL